MSDASATTRRGLRRLAATAGVVAAAGAMTARAGAASVTAAGSRIDPASVQLIFADLQVPLVAGSTTQPPDRIERAAKVLAEIVNILALPMLFSTVTEDGAPPHLLPALRPYAAQAETILRDPIAPFHDPATLRTLTGRRRPTLVVAGFAAEAVVLQTALDAVAAGYAVHYVADAVGSQSARTEAAAFRAMEMAGALPASVLSLATRLVPNFSGDAGKRVYAALQPLLHGD